MANCLPEPLAASKGRALICEGTAFGATQEKGGCRFTRSCQGSRLGILDLVENPGAGKRPVVSPSIQGEIPALKGQESRGKSRHVTLGKKTEILPSDDHMGLALGVDTLVTAGAAPSNHFRQTAAVATKAGLKREFEFEWQKPYAKKGPGARAGAHGPQPRCGWGGFLADDPG